MIYKFKSKAAGDVIMLGPLGDQVLRMMGREPAPKGIIEAAAIPAALQAIEQALSQQSAPPAGESADDKDNEAVGLKQRVWPFVELLKRSQAAGADVVWGV